VVTGKVKWFNPERGYGFVIRDDGGADVFVGSAALNAAHIPHLFEGDRIEFLIEMDRAGRERASEIRIVTTRAGAAE
jgi:CspA family cold shock protein